MKTPVNEFEGCPIYVDEKGTFSIVYQGRTVTANSLTALRSKLSKLLTAEKVIEPASYGSFAPHIRDVTVEFHDGARRFRDVDTGRLIDRFIGLYEFDAEIVEQLNQIDEEYSKLCQRRNAINEKLRPYLGGLKGAKKTEVRDE